MLKRELDPWDDGWEEERRAQLQLQECEGEASLPSPHDVNAGMARPFDQMDIKVSTLTWIIRVALVLLVGLIVVLFRAGS